MFPCTKELSLLSFTFLSLSFSSILHRESIRSHLQTTIYPQTLGITKVLFFKAGPVHLLPRVCGCGSREGGKLLRPRSPCTPCLSPVSSGAVLWGCHNCGLYNMGYCWRRLVTVDEAFKEASPLMVSVKILESRSKVWLPDNYRRSNGRTLGQREPAFCLVMGRGCSKSMFEKNVVQSIATLHYRLLSPLQKNETTLSILVLCLYACKLPTQNESSMFCTTQQCPFHKTQLGKKKIQEDYEICWKWTKLQNICSCCGAILLSWVLGEGVCKVKWDRKPWQCGGNSMWGFAAPGTHLFLQRVPVDLVSCRHMVKLDCGKHRHAEKNKRCFYFGILVITAEEESKCWTCSIFICMSISKVFIDI